MKEALWFLGGFFAGIAAVAYVINVWWRRL